MATLWVDADLAAVAADHPTLLERRFCAVSGPRCPGRALRGLEDHVQGGEQDRQRDHGEEDGQRPVSEPSHTGIMRLMPVRRRRPFYSLRPIRKPPGSRTLAYCPRTELQ